MTRKWIGYLATAALATAALWGGHAWRTGGTGAADAGDDAPPPPVADAREAAPDYAADAGWIRRPASPACAADVLFFLPTVADDAEGPRWCNLAADPEAALAACARTADCFDGAADVWVPAWRQLNRAALVGRPAAEVREELAGAESPAKADVFAALDGYFAHADGHRPFLLAGHGQGAEMAKAALAEYFPAHPELQARFVAAYVAGAPVTRSFFEMHPHLKAAAAPDDVGVVVAWNTEGGGNTDVMDTFAVAEGNVAINPLLWTPGTTPVPASLNYGSLMPAADGSWTLVRPGPADAAVNPFHGTVICTAFPWREELRSEVQAFGPESFHDLDFALYFLNIRSNAAERVAAFARRPGPTP